MLRTYLRALSALTRTHAVTSGGGAQDCSGTITVEEAMKAEDARFAAQMNNDFSTMDKLYGDDLVYIHSSTVQDTKVSFIESMRSGAVNK